MKSFLRQIPVLAFATVLSFALLGQDRPGTTPGLDGLRVWRDLAYVTGGHSRQTLDLYVPEEGQGFPLVIWVHGGAWRQGGKERPGALFLTREGFALASINYRLSQHATFPAQLEDCKAAVRWLRAQAAAYGFDPERIGVWGPSAGGHLAALLGVTGGLREFDVGEHLEQSSRVAAVVDWFGPTDFLLLNAQAGPSGRMDHDAPDSPESVLIGGPIQAHPDKVARANPISYVTPDDPPFLIMHGDQDPLVAAGQSRLLHDALQRAGVESTLKILEGTGHGGGAFNTPDARAAVAEFFRRHLHPAAVALDPRP